MFTIQVEQTVEQIREYDVETDEFTTKYKSTDGNVYLAIYELPSKRQV